MNSIQINDNYFPSNNYYDQNYNPSKSVNIMKYVNNINRINENYTRENILNENEAKEKEVSLIILIYKYYNINNIGKFFIL